MKFLLVARQKKNVDSFRTTIRLLLERGHEVRLAVQERDDDRGRRLADLTAYPGFSHQSAPTARSDNWRVQAPLVRRLRDWVQYLGPQYAGADKLRARVLDRLRAELGVAEPLDDAALLPIVRPAQAGRIRALLVRMEAAIPSDPLHDEFIGRAAPDVVLVTPGVHFGSAQADVIKSARAAGIPVWMLAFSWDNLSTKGALHVAPDLMFVWNKRQRREATELHDFPADRVVVVGAPRFDEFFALRPVLSRAQFFRPLGLDPAAPALLYVCSSPFVAPSELPFIRRWLAALRTADDAATRACNVIVRPHPDIPLIDDSQAAVVTWPGLARAQGWVSRPFDDPRVVVLRTTYATPQAFFECLHHSAAVVGLNTSAELEAAIAGRPVFTVMADDQQVTGQAGTLHFHYLLRENGGCVTAAGTLPEHVAQLAGALAAQADDPSIRAFAETFLRPRRRPAGPLLAKELETHAEAARSALTQESEPGREPVPARSAADSGGETSDVAGEDSRKLIRVGYPHSSLRVAATPETRQSRRDGQLVLDDLAVAWLDELVQPHDVVYDIGAGVGEHALVAATHRGARVFAFEAAFATFKRLCDNVLRNDCSQTVVPLPIALADQAALFELEYQGEAGEDRYQVRLREWRMRPYVKEARYVQPVCAERLDDVVARHKLPRPNHLRVRAPRSADAVLRGAVQTLRDPDLKSVLVIAPRRQMRDTIDAMLADAGLTLVPGPSRNETSQVLRFVREPASDHQRSWIR